MTMRSARMYHRPYRRRRPPNAQRLPTIGLLVLLAAAAVFVVGPALLVLALRGSP